MIHLAHGELALDLDPTRGMLATSWRRRDVELLAPGRTRDEDVVRVDTVRGMALLAPWANRLPGDRYAAEGRTVDLAGVAIERDDAGLPLHGTLTGRGDWTVLEVTGERVVAEVRLDADPITAAAFPFPARIAVEWQLLDDALEVTTTLTATGATRVPACFGWHPYLQLPGPDRGACSVSLPGRGERGIGPDTVDELVAIEAARVAALSGPGRTVTLTLGAGYDALQVWMPAGEPFVCLEPMVGRTGALADGTYAVATADAPYRATFTLGVRGTD